MNWTFSTELTNQEDRVTIYFFQTKTDREITVQALPYPQGCLPPFTMKFDELSREFKIIEDNVPDAIREYELIFSETILNLKNVSTVGLTEELSLN